MGRYSSPSFVRITTGDPPFTQSLTHFRLKWVASPSRFWMGHAISRTKPSIVASERFARAPSIDVLCRGAGITTIAAKQQLVKRQKRRIFILTPLFVGRISAVADALETTGGVALPLWQHTKVHQA